MENHVIDLRSDTVTQPTPAMREAMAMAEVGDDAYREDPTVQLLEQTAASLLGKESALFVSSGTMGNLVALMSHTHPGQEVILEANAHIYYYEAGGLARLAGLTPRLIDTPDGMIRLEQLQAALRLLNLQFAPAALFCLENTHNRAGGLVLPQEEVEKVTAYAKEMGLKTHLDGARLMNAAVYQNLAPERLAEPFDSVMLCLSKGLAAPVGSVLAGPADFIEKARLVRRILGGGMRQAGVLAAAGLTALTEMPKKLAEDHRRARKLGEGINKIPGLRVRGEVQTNIVIVDITAGDLDSHRLVEKWRQAGVLAGLVESRAVRLVTHYEITDADIEQVLEVTEEIMHQAR